MKKLEIYPTIPQAQIGRESPMAIDHDCQRCEFHDGHVKTHCMNPEGSPDGLYVMAEMPGAVEDAQGRPFAGGSGQYLRKLLKRFWAGPIALDNAVRCMPGSREVKNKHIDACRPYGAQVIRDVNPKRILALGNASVYAVMGRRVPIMSARRAYGWYTNDDGEFIPVFYLIPPAAAMRNRFVGAAFEKDLEWALTCSVPKPQFEGSTNLVDGHADAMVAWTALKNEQQVTYDIETSGRMGNPSSGELALAFQVIQAVKGRGNRFSIESVTLLGESADCAWTWTRNALNNKGAMDILRRILHKVPVVTQNGKYDDRGVLAYANIDVKEVAGDTRLFRKLLDFESAASLDVLAELVGMGGHKEEAQEKLDEICKELRYQANPPSGLTPTGKQRKIRPPAFQMLPEDLACIRAGEEAMAFAFRYLDDETLYRYNARDVFSTRAVHRVLKKQLEAQPKIKRVWDLIVKDANTAVRWIEHWGFACDQTSMEHTAQFCKAKVVEASTKLSKYGSVNPASPKQLQDFLFSKLKLKPTKTTKGGQFSTDAEVLDTLRDQHPAVQHILDIRKYGKLDGTYATGMQVHIREDGRIHATYLLDGAGTGRLSCIAEWTPIRTQRGHVPIRDLTVGDKVWTHRGRWRSVRRVFTKGFAGMYDLRLSNGEVLTCTTDHKLLLSTGVWKTVGEIIHERQQRLGQPQEESGGGSRDVSLSIYSDSAIDCKLPRNNTAQRVVCSSYVYAQSRVQGSCSGEVLSVETRRQESDDRQGLGETPTLEGGQLYGRGRLQDMLEWTQARNGSSREDGESSRSKSTSEALGCPSYRWGCLQQRSEQPSVGDRIGASDHPLFAGEGVEALTIETIIYRGSLEIHDMSVAEDQSYEACGVFSHNSQDPNMQNLPRADTLEGKMIRDCFIAPKDFVIVEADQSQIELRVAAMLSRDKNMMQDYINGIDIHSNNARECCEVVWGIKREQWDKMLVAKKADPECDDAKKISACRSQIKTTTFGKLYGKTDAGLAAEFGCDVKVVKAINAKIWGRYAQLAQWIQQCVAYSQKTGVTWTWWDGQEARRRHVWGIADKEEERAAHAARTAYNTRIQGTAADFTTSSLWPLVSYFLDEGLPAKVVATVHDSIVVEVHKTVLTEVTQKMKQVMTSWPSGGVPLVAEFKVGERWGSMSELKVA